MLRHWNFLFSRKLNGLLVILFICFQQKTQFIYYFLTCRLKPVLTFFVHNFELIKTIEKQEKMLKEKLKLIKNSNVTPLEFFLKWNLSVLAVIKRDLYMNQQKSTDKTI